MKHTGFAPIAAADARLLILGSMPGAASLRQQQYYGHPRNLFWSLIYGEAAAGMPYADKLAGLATRHLALWDVLHACRREGSLDSRIERDSEEANDLVGFLTRHPAIHTIAFNGSKAATAFRQHILKPQPSLTERYQLIQMPSTSPANAGIPLAERLAQWQALLSQV